MYMYTNTNPFLSSRLPSVDDHLSESNISNASNIRDSQYPLYLQDGNSNQRVQNRSFLSQPRPLNPDLDVHMNINTLFNPSPSYEMPMAETIDIPAPVIPFNQSPITKHKAKKAWKESDFQLTVVPSSATSSASTSLMEIEKRELERPSKLNGYLEQCGLPTLDFSQMDSYNKDNMYQDLIKRIAQQYEQRESIVKKLAKKTLYEDDHTPATDLIREANEKVNHILQKNNLTSKTSILDNIQSIGHRLRKHEQKMQNIDLLMESIENDTDSASKNKNVKTMNTEFDKRMETVMKRVFHMKRYKSKYKELLFLKYKMVDMIERVTDTTIDQFIEVDKLIPIVEKSRFPIKRIKEILKSRSYTPEWKIRELVELFNLFIVC